MSIIKPTTQSGVTPDPTEETISPFGAPIFAVAHAESKPRSPIVPASPPVQPASVPRNVLEVAAVPTAICPAAPAATHEGEPKEHSLSHELASRLGFPAALLLKYLAHRIAKSGTTHEGRRFIRVNLDHLTEVFPYLSRSCLADAVKTLTAGPQSHLVVHQNNRHPYDRTNNFAFRDPAAAGQARTHLRYFRPEDAKDHGLAAALILHNFRYWSCQPKAARDGWRTSNAVELAKVLPVTARQVRQALKVLADARVLERRAPEGGRRGWQYRLTEMPAVSPTCAETNDVTNPNGRETKVDMELPKLNMGTTNPDMGVTNPDMQVTNLDNNNYYQLPLAAPSLPAVPQQSFNYSVRPAEPCAVSVCDNSLQTGKKAPSVAPATSASRRASAGSHEVLDSAAAQPASIWATKPPGFVSLDASPACLASAGSPPPAGGVAPSAITSGPPTPHDTCTAEWPEDFNVMFEETEKGLKKFEKTQREPLERRFFEELTPFLKIQSDETLERWDHTTGRQNLYALFRPFAAQFTFPWLKLREPVIHDLFRKVMVARLVDTFLMESGRRVYLAGVPGPYILYLDEVCSRLMPLRKKREAEHQQRVIEERQTTFAARMAQHQSADAALEDDAGQPVAVKLKVLQNGIIARNVIGFPTREWELKSNLLAYTGRSLKRAREFFDTNPAATPGHLLSVMEASAQYIAENPDPHGEYDPKYVIRKGAHLTSLLNELPAIVAATQLSEDIPAFQLVPTGTDNNPGSPERSAPRGRNG